MVSPGQSGLYSKTQCFLFCFFIFIFIFKEGRREEGTGKEKRKEGRVLLKTRVWQKGGRLDKVLQTRGCTVHPLGNDCPHPKVCGKLRPGNL